MRHWTAGKRILRYIKKTVDLGLHYVPCATRDGRLELLGFADAAESDIVSSKAQTGWLYTLNGGVVAYRSSKQTLVTNSIADAEQIALADAVHEVITLLYAHEELEVHVNGPIPLRTDNRGIGCAHRERALDAREQALASTLQYYPRESLGGCRCSITHRGFG